MTTATTPTSNAATIGLDAEAAHIVRTTNLLARRAVDDRFVLALSLTVAAIFLVLGWSLHVRAEFRDNLPAFKPHTSIPAPLYTVTFREKKMTWDELVASVKASR